VVEFLPSKQAVVGSNPISRSIFPNNTNKNKDDRNRSHTRKSEILTFPSHGLCSVECLVEEQGMYLDQIGSAMSGEGNLIALLENVSISGEPVRIAWRGEASEDEYAGFAVAASHDGRTKVGLADVKGGSPARIIRTSTITTVADATTNRVVWAE
jgi:hypothetical protein